MWTATPRGFFSAVQHNTDPSLLVVRTRDHGDAVTLRDWYAAWQADMAKIGHALAKRPVPLEGPVPVITSYEFSDYPWRVIMPRSAFGAFMVESVEDLDYGNFKDAVKERQGADRAHVYGRVWSALLELEDLDPMGRRPVQVETPYDWPIPDEDEPWAAYHDWEDRNAPDATPQDVTAFLEAQEAQS